MPRNLVAEESKICENDEVTDITDRLKNICLLFDSIFSLLRTPCGEGNADVTQLLRRTVNIAIKRWKE